MASWRPALAGGAAFLASMAAEVGVVAAIGGAGPWPLLPLIAMPVLVAPLAEELAKRLFLRPFSAGWAATGLAFGVIEGVLKALDWPSFGPAGVVASVLQHWAYGRWAERGGLWLALALHAGFNALVLAVDAATYASAPWAAPLVAGLLLAASFRRQAPGGVDAAPRAP